MVKFVKVAYIFFNINLYYRLIFVFFFSFYTSPRLDKIEVIYLVPFLLSRIPYANISLKIHNLSPSFFF